MARERGHDGLERGHVIGHVDDVRPLGDDLEPAGNGVLGGVEEAAVVQDPHDLRRHGSQRTCVVQPVAPVKERTSRRFR